MIDYFKPFSWETADDKPRPERVHQGRVAGEKVKGAGFTPAAFRYWVGCGIFVGIFTVVAAVYGRSSGFAFLSWDDDQNILNNRWLAPGLWTQFWYKPYLCLYIPPVYTLWYALSQAMSPLAPQLFHSANLVVHLVNSYLVYAIAWRFPADGRIDPKLRRGVAFCASLLFAVHPLQTETVAWVTGMRDLLSATGALAAVFCVLDEAGPAHPVIGWLFFVLAMLCKPSAVALPAALWGLSWAYQTFSARQRVITWLPWFAATLPIIAVTRFAQTEITDPLNAKINLARRFAVALDSYGFYIRKGVFPTHLVNDYGRSPTAALGSSDLPLNIGVLVAFVVAVWWSRNLLGKRALAWLGFAGVMLLPTSGIVAFPFQHTSTVADHYAYVSMAGLAVFISAGLAHFPWRWVLLASATVTGLWSYLASEQLAMWRSDSTLFPAMVQENPRSYGGLTGLSALAMRQQHFAEALTYILAAEQIEPLKVDLLANKAMALNQLGRYDQVLNEIAIHLPNKQLVLASPVSAPSVSALFMNVAYADMKLGNFADSLPYLCMAQWADPHNNDVNTFLPIVLQRLGRDPAEVNLCTPFIN